jgi:hypothetical protein
MRPCGSLAVGWFGGGVWAPAAAAPIATGVRVAGGSTRSMAFDGAAPRPALSAAGAVGCHEVSAQVAPSASASSAVAGQTLAALASWPVRRGRGLLRPAGRLQRPRARRQLLAGRPARATRARIHRAGARAYLTLNTLVFEPELEPLERVLRASPPPASTR